MKAKLNICWLLIRKDLKVELRNREILIATFTYSLLLLAIFVVTLEPSMETSNIAPALLWVGIAFAATAGFTRSWEVEKEFDALRGTTATPIPRELILFSKSISNFILISFTSAILIFLVSILFNIGFLHWGILGLYLLALFGFSLAGTTFAALAQHVRAKQIMAALLFVPVSTPMIVATVETARLLFSNAPFIQFLPWLLLIIAFNILYIVVILLMANVILEDD